MVALRPLFRSLVAAALPPRCPACSVVVAEDHRFCADCWGKLRFLGEPCCAVCGVPFETDRGGQARCGACLADPPGWDAARAAVAYDETARALVLRLKYGGRIGLAETMARLMVRRFPADADLIVPVPLHRRRIGSRGFNQSALIGDALARLTGVRHDPLLLKRVKATPPLRGLGARARARVVAGAFAVADGAALADRHVVLVDDVHTSGATAAGCAMALKRAGAARVTLLCWARVLRPDAAID